MKPSELKEAIRELDMSYVEFAKQIGISERSLYYRMSGEQTIRAGEALAVNMMLAAKRAADDKAKK